MISLLDGVGSAKKKAPEKVFALRLDVAGPWPGALPEAARRAAPELERGARSEEGGDATRRDMLPGGTRERHLRSKVR